MLRRAGKALWNLSEHTRRSWNARFKVKVLQYWQLPAPIFGISSWWHCWHNDVAMTLSEYCLVRRPVYHLRKRNM